MLLDNSHVELCQFTSISKFLNIYAIGKVSIIS